MKKSKKDIQFEKMIEEVMRAEGERLLAENERLKSDPSAAVPEEVDRRILEFINHGCTKD